MKPKTDSNYVALYANALKRNNSIFKQQKVLIESQLEASKSLFKHRFGRNFNANAREYLRNVELL